MFALRCCIAISCAHGFLRQTRRQVVHSLKAENVLREIRSRGFEQLSDIGMRVAIDYRVTERSEGALRILNAYAAFGLSLMRNEIPTRPALSQQAQRAKLERAAFKQ